MKFPILLFSLLMYFGVSGQDFLNKTIQKDSALADFQIFKSALISGHPGLYWYKTKDEIEKSFNNAESQINKDISNREFHKILTSVMNDISCGHSIVLYPKTYSSEIIDLQIFLPFKVSLVEDKLFITETLSDTDVPVGSQIISINNKSIEDILNVIESKIPADKGINTKKTRSLDILFSYYYTLFVENSKQFNIKFIDENNKTIQKNIDAISFNKAFMFRSPKEYAASRTPLSYKIEDNIAELKITTFGVRNYKMNAVNYEDTLAKIFKELKIKKIDNLIIDLRGNNGGALGFPELLYSYLITKDTKFNKFILMNEDIAEGNFKYTELPKFLDMFEQEYGSLSKQNKQYIIPGDTAKVIEDTYTGNVYFLTDGLSFSATSDFLAMCKENNIGKIIGETPGGAYVGCNAGSPIFIALPNSDYRLMFYILGIRLDVKDDINSIDVDYKVSSKIDDLLKKDIDIQKEFVIDLIKKSE